jgi:hypothetical protein
MRAESDVVCAQTRRIESAAGFADLECVARKRRAASSSLRTSASAGPGACRSHQPRMHHLLRRLTNRPRRPADAQQHRRRPRLRPPPDQRQRKDKRRVRTRRPRRGHLGHSSRPAPSRLANREKTRGAGPRRAAECSGPIHPPDSELPSTINRPLEDDRRCRPASSRGRSWRRSTVLRTEEHSARALADARPRARLRSAAATPTRRRVQSAMALGSCRICRQPRPRPSAGRDRSAHPATPPPATPVRSRAIRRRQLMRAHRLRRRRRRGRRRPADVGRQAGGREGPGLLLGALRADPGALLALEVARVLATHGEPVLESGGEALAAALRRPPWYRHG